MIGTEGNDSTISRQHIVLYIKLGLMISVFVIDGHDVWWGRRRSDLRDLPDQSPSGLADRTTCLQCALGMDFVIC